MSYIRLHKDGFFRRYTDIGYLWQQKDRRSLVLDNNGAIFFEELTREPQSLEDIAKRLSQKYQGVTLDKIKADFLAFMQRFVSLGIVVIADTVEGLTNNEIGFSYAKAEEGMLPTPKQSLSITDNENNVNDFLTKHFEKNPQLLSLQIEITPNCNLRCVHCYLACGTPDQACNIQMSKEQIFKVLDEFRALGGLHITFTGGEAMLNKDLPELLRYAREKDLNIWILTNAVLLNDKLLEIMQETNVAGVQVSLYSTVNEDHDAVTQVKGSCERTKQNIEKLLAANIPVQLGCPVMKENFHSFHTVLDWGHERHLEVKVNNQIFARADFSTDNLDHRISLEEQESFIKKTLDNSPIYQERLLNSSEKEVRPVSTDPVCGAGRYMLCLEASGNYYPCPGFKLILGNCQEQTLADIWKHSEKLNKLRHLTNAAYKTCLKCPSRSYCNLCPGKLYNESGGDMFALSDYFCRVAHINRKIAEEFVRERQEK